MTVCWKCDYESASGLHHITRNVPHKTSKEKILCIEHFVIIQQKPTAKNTAEDAMTVANRIIRSKGTKK